MRASGRTSAFRLKTAVLLALVVAAAIVSPPSASSAGAAKSRAVPLSQLAPADEYFGRLHLSIIVIRHKIFAIKDDFHHARVDPDKAQHDAEGVQDALLDWSRRFPNDTWLPSATWNLATLYEELPGVRARRQAVSVLQLVRSRFAGSPFAAYARRDLTRGIGVRPWPQWAMRGLPADAPALLQAVVSARALRDSRKVQSALMSAEDRYWRMSHSGTDPQYAQCAWELAASYEQLPTSDARDRAVRLLALLLDRYPSQQYGARALRELERGITPAKSGR